MIKESNLIVLLCSASLVPSKYNFKLLTRVLQACVSRMKSHKPALFAAFSKIVVTPCFYVLYVPTYTRQNTDSNLLRIHCYPEWTRILERNIRMISGRKINLSITDRYKLYCCNVIFYGSYQLCKLHITEPTLLSPQPDNNNNIDYCK